MTNNVPEAALKKLREAEELHKSMYETQDTPTTVDTPTTDHADDATKNRNEDLTATPVIENNDDDGHVEPEAMSLEEQYRKLEAAHKTLQGKYRAEVPRLNEQVRNLIQELSVAKQAKATAEQSADTAKAELGDVTARLQNEIGSDATDALSDYTKQLVKDELGKTQAVTSEVPTAESNFWDRLYAKVPDFDAVNNSPDFVEWLKGTDDETGLPFQFGLDEAGKTFDVLTVADITRQFKRDQKQPPKALLNNPSDHIAAPKTQKRSTVKETPQYTPADYEALQNQIQRGQWKGREAEANQLEQQIHAALTGS